MCEGRINSAKDEINGVKAEIIARRPDYSARGTNKWRKGRIIFLTDELINSQILHIF